MQLPTHPQKKQQMISGILSILVGVLLLALVVVQSEKPIINNNPVTRTIDRVWCTTLSDGSANVQQNIDTCMNEAGKERQKHNFL